MSLAIFAALVAAITVVASMTVVGAVALLFYSAAKQQEDEELMLAPMPAPPPMPTMPQGSTSQSLAGVQATPPTTFQGQQRLNMIDARHLVGYFEEEESSLAHLDASHRRNPSYPPAPPVQRDTLNQERTPPYPHRPPAASSPPSASRSTYDGQPSYNAQPPYGAPGWTEEEGATEIFSANNTGELSDFGLIEEEPTRIAATTAAATRVR